jgi:hypothetical protein
MAATYLVGLVCQAALLILAPQGRHAQPGAVHQGGNGVLLLLRIGSQIAAVYRCLFSSVHL